MKKHTNKKGELLVETITAMAIAAVVVVGVFGVFRTFSSLSKRQTEYIHFETVCMDIDKYYDAFGKEMWDEEYFGKDKYEIYVRDAGDQYVYVEEYTEEFEPLEEILDPNDDIGYTYKLTYKYDGDDLQVNVKNIDSQRMVVNNLNYGRSNAINAGDYYEQVMANNPLVYEVEEEED